MKNYKERFRKLAIMGSSLAALTIASNQIAMAQSPNENSAQTPVEQQKDDDSDKEIVVTGFRASLEGSLNAKRNSQQISDSITAEDINDFPDQNVVEALGRITGVQIQRDNNGEGERFQVRGISDVRIEIDGQRQVGGRFDGGVVGSALPSELFGSVEVIKTQAASDTEGGTGGIVRFNTREVLSSRKDFTLAGSAENIYSENADDFGYKVSATLSKNFRSTAIGDFGFVASFTKGRTKGAADSFLADGGYVLDSSLSGDFNGNGIANEPVTTRPFLDRTVPSSFGDALVRPGGSVGARYNTIDRSERSFNINLQWKPADNLSIYARTTQTRQRNEDQTVGFNATFPSLANADPNSLVIENGVVVAATIPNPGTLGLFGIRPNFNIDQNTYQAGIKWDASSRLRLEFKYERGEGDTNNPIIVPIIAGGLNVSIPVRIDLRTGVPTVNAASVLDISPGFGGNFSPLVIGLVDFDLRERQRDTAYQFDATYQLDAGIFSRIKIGGRYNKLQNRLTRRDFNQFDGFGGPSPLPFRFRPLADFAGQFPSLVRDFSRPDSFSGQNQNNLPSSFTFIDLDFFRTQQFLDEFRSDNFLRDPADPNSAFGPTVNLGSQRDGGFEIFAGYAQLDLDGNFPVLNVPFSGNFGTRVVRTKQRVFGLLLNDQNVQTPGFQEGSNTRILPSLSLNFDLSKNLKLRLGAGRTLSRPNLQDLTPSENRLPNENILEIGNPGLKPVTVDGIDGSLEWYFGKGGLLSFAAFYKSQKNLSGRLATIECLPDTDSPAVRPNQGGVGEFRDPRGVQVCTDAGLGSEVDLRRNDFFVVSSTRNIGSSTIKGFEVGYQQNFTFLPAPFDGLGAIANYTFTDGKTPLVSPLGQDLPLLGASKHSFNLTAYYEKAGFSARASYNYRTKFLQNGGTGVQANIGVNPQVRGSYGQLDAALSYKVTDNLTFTVDGINLLRTKQDDFADFRQALLQRTFTDRRIFFGARVGF
jgi:iron complex outermembrane recepter protein